mmetsp:Transcript_10196/g.14413  ORF Transcript_10196/g.14413 Transcript_10196/m.14413 type:complete len:92 (+) Transcript_10196:267-542(+)
MIDRCKECMQHILKRRCSAKNSNKEHDQAHDCSCQIYFQDFRRCFHHFFLSVYSQCRNSGKDHESEKILDGKWSCNDIQWIPIILEMYEVW